MLQEIKMPNAGQTTDEATIVSVPVQAGDRIKRGDVLVEAETDKAILPVESYAAGVILDVLVSEGDLVHAGDVLMVVGKEEDRAAYRRGSSEVPSAPAAPSPDVPEAGGDDYLPIQGGVSAVYAPEPAAKPAAMPNAKLLARELGVELSGLTPQNGRFLTRKDIQAAAPAPAAPVDEPDAQLLSLSRTRQVIGRRMLESVQTIPSWQCVSAVDMSACMELRQLFLERRGIKLSYNDLIAKAVAVAARKYPLVNARYEKDGVRMSRHTSIGLAVASEDALLVPVVRDVDLLGLEEISVQYQALIQKAREGRLSPAECNCGSVTISNLGMYGVEQFCAIVNPPESCILAVGGIHTEPVWDGAQFQPVPRMRITGSYDHRLIDGAYGAQFQQELQLLLEHPALLLA